MESEALIMKVKREQNEKVNFKSQVAALRQPWTEFVGFLKQHPILAGGIAAVLALIYGGQAFSNYYYIDKEGLVNEPGSFYNWGEIGRFGLILTKKILGMSWYNPYLGGVMLMIALWMAAMTAGYLFYSVERRLTAPALGIFMLLFLVYPTYVEQFLFQFQAFEVVLAMVFLLVSDWYLALALRENNRISFMVSVPLVIIAFGTYQSMVPLQLCLYLGIFLMLACQADNKKALVSSIKYSALHFAAAFGIYEAISQFFFSGSSYLSSQIVWRTGDYRAAFFNILGYIGSVVKAKACYTLTYDLCWCIGLAALLVLFMRYRRKAVWYGLGLLGVVLSPFFLSFITGSGQTYRAQLTLPMACGILWLSGIRVVSCELRDNWKNAAYALLLTAGCIMIFLNTAPLMRMLYTRDVIGKADEMTATMLIGDLNEYPSVYQGKPVIFVGHRAPMTNGACYETHDTYTFFSAFEMDYMFEPYYFYSTHRILGFFKTLGFQYFQGPPDGAMMLSACEDSENMPVWPLEGSIQEFEDYIIVKLGPLEF